MKKNRTKGISLNIRLLAALQIIITDLLINMGYHKDKP